MLTLFDQPAPRKPERRAAPRARGLRGSGSLPGCLKGDYAAHALAWMGDHPEAWAFFEAQALAAARRGRRFGAKAIAERVRWEFRIERGQDGFKLNNNITAYLARELIRKHPWAAPFVELREGKWAPSESQDIPG